MHPILLDAAGHRRQPITLSGYHAGRPLRNKGRRYPADPPTVEEFIAVMRAAGAGRDGMRLRALIVVLWRAGLCIGEALALAETDLDARRGAVLVRHGKGGYVECDIGGPMLRRELCCASAGMRGRRWGSGLSAGHIWAVIGSRGTRGAGRWPVAAGLTLVGAVRSSARRLSSMSAWRYLLVVSRVSWPSHSAIVATSTGVLACRSRIAVV